MSDKVNACVFDPSNNSVESSFEQLDDGSFRVSFKPLVAGNHKLKVFKGNDNEPISEFIHKIGDEMVGGDAFFTINIGEQKKRSYSATVTSPSNKQVECTNEKSAGEKYLVRFWPKELGEHVIRIFQDDSGVPVWEFIYNVTDLSCEVGCGSPSIDEKTFSFDDKEKKVTDPGEERTRESKASITTETDEQVGKEYSATVISPSKTEVKCIFEELDDGTCKIRFVPKELGKYVIKIFKVGKDDPISEFTFDAKEEHKEETANFTITIQERNLTFSATVTSPSGNKIDCTVKETGEGHCIVQFTPTEVGDYTIRIFEDNEKLPVSTIIYKIVDHKYDISCKLPSENIFRIGELVESTVNVAEAKVKYSATVISPSNVKIDCKVEESGDGNCNIKFAPKEAGDYTIRIFQGDNPIPVSVFTYTIKTHTTSTTSTPNVTKQVNFSVDIREPSAPKYSATVTSPSGEDLHCRIEDTDDGSCRVRFIPTELGDYVVRIFEDDMETSQFTYTVNDLTKSETTKINIDDDFDCIRDEIFKLAEKYSFYLDPEGKANKFIASVTSPGQTLLSCDVEESSPDVFVIRFTPKESGDHVIKIYNNNKGVPVYQFVYKVKGLLEKPVEFKVISSSPEPGRLAYKITCPPKSKVNYINNKDGGLYEINARLNEAEKPKNTTTPDSGASKCTSEGEGLRTAKIGEDAIFKVNAGNAGKGSLKVGMEGPTVPEKGIVLEHIGNDVYSVKYALDMEGDYSIYAMWNGEHIPGSPFHVKV